MNISIMSNFVLSYIPPPVVLVRRTKNTQLWLTGLLDEHIYNVYFCFVRYSCPCSSCKKNEEHPVMVDRSIR